MPRNMFAIQVVCADNRFFILSFYIYIQKDAPVPKWIPQMRDGFFRCPRSAALQSDECVCVLYALCVHWGHVRTRELYRFAPRDIMARKKTCVMDIIEWSEEKDRERCGIKMQSHRHRACFFSYLKVRAICWLILGILSVFLLCHCECMNTYIKCKHNIRNQQSIMRTIEI